MVLEKAANQNTMHTIIINDSVDDDMPVCGCLSATMKYH